MLNDFLCLQFLLIFILLLLNTNIELFFIILNSIIYLFIIVCYTWLHDVEIIINFLLIIDLGVFFILLAFILNLTNLFTQLLMPTQLSRNLLLIIGLVILYYILQYNLSILINIGYVLYLQLNWFFLIIYYN